MDQVIVIVGHRGARYALDAQAVREIVWLPELSPVQELPSFVIGVMNLRGRVVPIIDLGLRLGIGADRLRKDDRVVVVEQGEARVGIVVHQLFDVVTVSEDAFVEASQYQGAGGAARFVSGQLKLDDGLVMLLDLAALLREAPSGEQLEAPSGEQEPLDAADETFRARRDELARVPADAEVVGRTSFAVVRIGGELFGLDAQAVSEFAHLRGLTPVPCSSPQIAGNMNLRGDILTVIDACPALGVVPDAAMNELAVVALDDLRFGLLIEEIVDMVGLSRDELVAMPVASRGEAHDCCAGVATVRGNPVSILDLRKVLASPAMQLGV